MDAHWAILNDCVTAKPPRHHPSSGRRSSGVPETDEDRRGPSARVTDQKNHVLTATRVHEMGAGTAGGGTNVQLWRLLGAELVGNRLLVGNCFRLGTRTF